MARVQAEYRYLWHSFHSPNCLHSFTSSFIQQTNSYRIPTLYAELLWLQGQCGEQKEINLFPHRMDTLVCNKLSRAKTELLHFCCVHLKIMLTYHLYSQSPSEMEGTPIFWVCNNTCVISIVRNQGDEKTQVQAFSYHIIKVLYFLTALEEVKEKMFSI